MNSVSDGLGDKVMSYAIMTDNDKIYDKTQEIEKMQQEAIDRATVKKQEILNKAFQLSTDTTKGGNSGGSGGTVPEGEEGKKKSKKEKKDEEAKKLKKQYDDMYKSLELLTKFNEENYKNSLDEIQLTEKLSGETVDSLKQKYDLLATRIQNLGQDTEQFKKQFDFLKASMSDAEKETFKGITGVDFSAFVSKTALEQQRIALAIDKEDNSVLDVKVDALIKVNAEIEKMAQNAKNYGVELKLAKRAITEKDYNTAKELNDIALESQRIDNDSVFMNKDAKYRTEIGYLQKVVELEQQRLAYMQTQKYSEVEIAKQELALKKATQAADEYSNSLRKEVRGQLKSITSDLLVEGKSLSDIWANLWKQLADDALSIL